MNIVQQILNAVFSKTAMMLTMVILLFATWIGLEVAKMVYPGLNVEAIIATIQLALGGLGVSHLKDLIAGMKGKVDSEPSPGDTTSSPPTDVTANGSQSGRSMLAMLVLVCSVAFTFITVTSVTGCVQFGLQPAKTFDEKLAYSYGTVASLRSSTASALATGSIRVEDAVEVQNLADQARALLDSARTLEHVDITTANGKLLLASSILVQLQNYTTSRGIK